MSTLYGVNYTKYNTGPTEDNIQARGMVSGDVSFMRDTYEASATSAGDVVYIGHPLNSGDRIIGYILSTDDLGTSVTMDIGTLADDDEFASAIDVQAAAVSGNTACIVDGVDYVVGTTTNDNIITLTLNTAAATGTIKITILYSRA